LFPYARLFTSTIAVCAVALLFAPAAGAFEFLAKWGGTGSGPGQLNNPFDLAVNPDTGHQYIADNGNDRIVEFDAGGGFVRAWGSSGAGNTQFNGPSGVGVDAAGNVWVADEGNNRIKKFDPNGNLLTVFGTTGTGPGQLSGPDDVAVDAGGNFYEVEQTLSRVQKFNAAGNYVTQWSAPDPTGIAVFETTVYVVNYNSDTGESFSTGGTPQGSFGGTGSGPGNFSQPWHIGVGGDGRLYVADRSNERVQSLNPSGTFINAFGWGVSSGAAAFEVCSASCQAGLRGGGDGQFREPGGVGVDRDGNVYVVEQSGNRVQKFGESGMTNSPCAISEFTFGQVSKNKRRGTATLAVAVPCPGQLALSGKGLKPSGATAAGAPARAAATVQLLIKPKGVKRRKLERAGRVKVKPKVTYTPTNGAPTTASTKIKLVKRR
jgi:hypothetical protein